MSQLQILFIEDDPAVAESLQVGPIRDGFGLIWKSMDAGGMAYAQKDAPPTGHARHGEDDIDLTPIELRLLTYLARHRGRAMMQEQSANIRSLLLSAKCGQLSISMPTYTENQRE
ncbi:MAG TPA: hypothetical protein VLX61_16360 [Anaerolineales bacterium]|nr:hypothetical protein [Anaerolineales bacterium]